MPAIVSRRVERRGVFLQNNERSRSPAAMEPIERSQKEISTSQAEEVE